MDPFQTLQSPSLLVRRSSRAERFAYGKSLRDKVPRSQLGQWRTDESREDPVDQVIASCQGRIKILIPVRNARMADSPYGFFRGAAGVCADDCARLPATGIMPVVCGDAHMGNFGFYRSPEGELVLDVNDFDEAHPGCWEWDVRRLTASLWVAGRDNNVSESHCREAVLMCVNAYRDELHNLAQQPLLARCFNRLDVNRLQETVSEETLHDEVERAVAKAKMRTSDRAIPKLTKVDVDGQRRIVDDPPLVIHSSTISSEKIGEALDGYLNTLQPQWRRMLDGYTLVDVAHKVVGVGSVGLRSYIVLLQGSSPKDLLFLQLKQARRSVLAKHVHGELALHEHQGQRVTEYQQCLQTAADPLLGWATSATLSPDGPVQFYVRQYRNMKGAITIDGLDPAALIDYAGVLGLILAKSHARTSGASMISGYIGKSDKVAEAMAKFAHDYADQNESDHAEFVHAIKKGRIPAEKGL